MNKIRKGDTVMVLVGRDKGKRGTVSRVILNKVGKPDKVLVEGLNLVTVFERPNPQKNEPGGVNRREAPMHACKVAVVDPDSNLPARVKFVQDAEGKKVRRFYVSRKRMPSSVVPAAVPVTATVADASVVPPAAGKEVEQSGTEGRQ